MPDLKLTVLSLRYSSWSMRAWLALRHAGARFETETVELPHMQKQSHSDDYKPTSLAERRALGSVSGFFPVLRIDDVPIHESLAICEYVAETFPQAQLWPEDIQSRAQARAISCEMASGFANLRNEMSCHMFARVPGFSPGADAIKEIERIFELWQECLERSGGPFLFGNFSIADIMYFPVLTRFRTYSIPIHERFTNYTRALDTLPAINELVTIARGQPRTPVYDDYVSQLGGDPDSPLASG